MIYRGYLISHGGRIRSNNEDNGYLDGVYRQDDSLFCWQYQCEKRRNIVCGVFDGVGGEDYGEAASRIAAGTLAEFEGGLPLSDLFAQYAYTANRHILEDGRSNRMASTFVLLSVEEDQYHFCNMGDSRGYLFREGNLLQISEDHNMVTRLFKKGILTAEQALKHPHRHAIYQYLGMEEESGQEDLTLEPYISSGIAAQKKDICLLCSDGLTDMVSDTEILKILNDENALLENKAESLLGAALENGGKDNITILLLEASRH